jgi:hypothetical protein
MVSIYHKSVMGDDQDERKAGNGEAAKWSLHPYLLVEIIKKLVVGYWSRADII